MEAAVVGAVAGVGTGILGGVGVGVGVGIVSGALTAAVKTWMTVPTPVAEEEPNKKPKKKFIKPEPKVEDPEEEEEERLSAGQKRRLLEKKKKEEAKAKEEEAKKAAAAQKKANKGKQPAKGGKPEAKDNKPELSSAGSPAIKGAAAPAVKAAAAAPAKSAAAPPAKTSAAEPAEDGKKKKKKKKPAGSKAADEPAGAETGAAAPEQAAGADVWEQQPSQLREAARAKVAAQKRAEADAKKASAGAQAVSEAFEVPSKDHGVVIGKGGLTLKAIQNSTNTKITIPKKESGQQFILIEGEKRGIELAKRAIRQIIDTGISDVTNPDTVVNEIEIPASASGLLVGEKGATRKKIEDELKVKLQIPEKDENSKVAVIKLVGPDDRIELAKSVIRSLVEDGFHPLTHEGWVKFQVVFPQSHLKHLFGNKGAALKSLQKSTSTRITVPPKEERQTTGPYANTVIITIVGPQGGVESARAQMSQTAAIVEEDMTPVLLEPDDDWAGPSADRSAQNEW